MGKTVLNKAGPTELMVSEHGLQDMVYVTWNLCELDFEVSSDEICFSVSDIQELVMNECA